MEATADSPIYFSGSFDEMPVQRFALMRGKIIRTVRRSLAAKPLARERFTTGPGGYRNRTIDTVIFDRRYRVTIENKGRDGVCITGLEDLDRKPVQVEVPMLVRGNQVVGACVARFAGW